MASILAGSAAGLAWLASRRALVAVSAALAAALGAAFASGGSGPFDAARGLHCVATEIASAGAMLLAAVAAPLAWRLGPRAAA